MVSKFVVGDIVRLRSGGPKVTITCVNNDTSKSVDMQWFTESLTDGWVLRKAEFVEQDSLEHEENINHE